jgi:hypothetical protein
MIIHPAFTVAGYREFRVERCRHHLTLSELFSHTISRWPVKPGFG